MLGYSEALLAGLTSQQTAISLWISSIGERQSRFLSRWASSSYPAAISVIMLRIRPSHSPQASARASAARCHQS